LDGYTIKRGVGHGGFGEVYYATSDAGKEVALKLIRRSLDVELRGIKQCLNLKHHNLLGVFDIKEDNRGDQWVIMEYVSGDCLDEVIARYPDGMPTHEALSWFGGIAAGVIYLHDHGIVHRDLKPGNVFSEEGQVKIGDYGLSKFISCSRRSGHTESVGTVHYMAPEVANGRYGKEIDVYALGIMLYEMLTGRLPFEGESVGEVLMKHLTAKPDVSMLDEPYRSVVARALEKDPEKRYSTVDEMLAELPAEASAGILPHARITQTRNTSNGSNGSNGSAKPKVSQPRPQPNDAPVAVAVLEEEEPVLRAVKQFWDDLCAWHSELNPGAKVAVTLVAILVLISTVQLWFPATVLALICYGIYRAIRWFTLPYTPPIRQTPPARPAEQARPSPSPAVGDNGRKAAAHRKRYRPHRPYEKPVYALIVKSRTERLADLLGSMLLASVVAMILTLVVTMLTASWWGQMVNLGLVAYVLLVSIAGSWAVLIPSKCWEGIRGDTMLRRFIMMTIGVALGAFAWCCFDLLVETLPLQLRVSRGSGPAFGTSISGQVLLFGLLMVLIRWWHQADPLRRVRLSLWAVLFSLFPPFLLTFAEEPIGVLLLVIAGIMSFSIQVAAPWVNPRLRLTSSAK
jgi:serine/threonine protein kinase